MKKRERKGGGKKGGTQGAEVVVGGNRDGAVFYPTILKNVNEDMKVMCEKVFAPVISIVPYINVDEVFARFNDSNFGLQAGIFTSELHLAMRATHELDFGGVNINDVSTFRADILSYGGVKNSGVGKEESKSTIEKITNEKVITFHI